MHLQPDSWEEYENQKNDLLTGDEQLAFLDGSVDAALGYDEASCELPNGPLRMAWHQGHSFYRHHKRICLK
jgi:hypothetical protein